MLQQYIRGFGRKKPPPSARINWEHPLSRGLTGCWLFNGDRGFDYTLRSRFLSPTGNPLYVPSDHGGVSTRLLASSSQYWSSADSPVLSTGDIDFFFVALVDLASKPANVMTILSKEDSIASAAEYRMEWRNTTDRFRFIIFNSAGGATGVAADALGVPSVGKLYFVMVWHDSIANTINIQVNNSATNSAAEGIAIVDSTATFRIGALSTGTVSNFWNGRVAGVWFWKRRLLSLSDRLWLQNEPFEMFQQPITRTWFV